MTKREKNLLAEYCEKLFLINRLDSADDFGFYDASVIRKCCIESTVGILGYSLESVFINMDDTRITYLITFSRGSKILLSEFIDVSNVVCFGLDYVLSELDFNKTVNEMIAERDVIQ